MGVYRFRRGKCGIVGVPRDSGLLVKYPVTTTSGEYNYAMAA